MNNKTIQQISKEEMLAKYEGKDKVVSSFEKKKEIEEQKIDFFMSIQKFPRLIKALMDLRAAR